MNETKQTTEQKADIKKCIQLYKDQILENPNAVLTHEIRIVLTEGIEIGWNAALEHARTERDVLLHAYSAVVDATQELEMRIELASGIGQVDKELVGLISALDK